MQLSLESLGRCLGLVATGFGCGGCLACGLELAPCLLGQLTGPAGRRLERVALGCKPHELGRQLLATGSFGVSLLVCR